MNRYVGYVSLTQSMERKEARRRIKEAKLTEHLDQVKYYQAWDRLAPLYEKWGSSVFPPPAIPTDSTNPAVTSHQIPRLVQLEARRHRLKDLVQEEDEEYQQELRDLDKNKPQASNGITANFVDGTGSTEKPKTVPGKPKDLDRESPLQKGSDKSLELGTLGTSSRPPPPTSTSSGMNHEENHQSIPLPVRRDNLKKLLQAEQLDYERELGDRKNNSRVQHSTGITKNELASKHSDDYSNRKAFLSGKLECRRKEELSHYKLFPSPNSNTTKTTKGTASASLASASQIGGDHPSTLPTTTVVPQCTAVIKVKPKDPVFRFW